MTDGLARGIRKAAEIAGYGLYGFIQGVKEGTYAVHAWPSATKRAREGRGFLAKTGPSVPGYEENNKDESKFWGAAAGELVAVGVECGAYVFTLGAGDLYILFPAATNAVSYLWEKSREKSSAKKRGRGKAA